MDRERGCARCVREVPWRDLAPLRAWETARELLLPMPWLVLSLGCASQGLHVAALPASFLFFLTGLRQVHDAWHRALGLPRAACDLVIVAHSFLMLGSMHAVRVTHMLHHRRCLEPNDVEGESARLSWALAIFAGPLFFARKHRSAWRLGSRRDRAWIACELLLNAAWVGMVFGVLRAPVLKYHVLTMAAGQWLFPFFSVWLVHHGCQGHPAGARSLRGPILSRATYGMLYHVEHHLFPAVPTCRLSHLAARLDALQGAGMPRVHPPFVHRKTAEQGPGLRDGACRNPLPS